jgi:hypothetical protein
MARFAAKGQRPGMMTWHHPFNKMDWSSALRIRFIEYRQNETARELGGEAAHP